MKTPNTVVKVNYQCWEDAAAGAVDELFRFSSSYLAVDYPVLITENPKTEFVRTESHLTNINSIIDLYVDSKIYLIQTDDYNSIQNHKNFIYMISNSAIGLAKTLCGDGIGMGIFVTILKDTLVKKQKDYGPANINKFGVTGIAIRMYDKVGRLNNLIINNKNNSIDETIFDTALDLIGYCSIAYMLLNNTFNTPMSEI